MQIFIAIQVIQLKMFKNKKCAKYDELKKGRIQGKIKICKFAVNAPVQNFFEKIVQSGFFC